MIKSPIQKVSERLQFRAIGIIHGLYEPIDENLNRGVLIDSKGTKLDTVVLGKALPLIKKHINFKNKYFWIVYPRNKNSESLHLQISGIWDPGNFNNGSEYASNNPHELLNQLNLKDNYFSIRGKLIFVNLSKKEIVVRINQSQFKNKLNNSFKLVLKGELSLKQVNSFVSLEVMRIGNTLEIINYEFLETESSLGN